MDDIIQREPIDNISMAAILERFRVGAVWYEGMCSSGRHEACCYSLSWRLDDRFGARAAESKLAQGPDRRGARAARSCLRPVRPWGCVLDTAQVGNLVLTERRSGILLLQRHQTQVGVLQDHLKRILGPTNTMTNASNQSPPIIAYSFMRSHQPLPSVIRLSVPILWLAASMLI